MHTSNNLNKIIYRYLITSLLLICPLTYGQEVLKADSIVINGKIMTMDSNDILSSDPGTIVEAMAIRDGLILALGSTNEMLQLVKPGTRIMDVQGKMVLPGFIETHVHPESTMNNVELYADERDAYSWAPGLHFAVLIEQDGTATLNKVRQILGEFPPLADEWIHIYMIPNEETDYPDIGSLTKGIYDEYISAAEFTRAIPDTPAALGSGTGQSIVRQEDVVVRVTLTTTSS